MVVALYPARNHAVRSFSTKRTARRSVQVSTRSVSSNSPAMKSMPFMDYRSGGGTGSGGDGVLRMLMFGKPGAGKGTLSSRLLAKYDVQFLSTGDLLRQHIAEKSDVGRKAEAIVAQGGLVPDELMLQIISSSLMDLRGKHWILDGFPRTVMQGKMLDSQLRETAAGPLSLIVNLDVSDEVILNRITDRWVHLPSGRVYNTSYNKPRVEGRDDVTGENLIKRPDDNPETFKRRLSAFYAQTSPLLAYYNSTTSASTTKMVSLTGKTSDEIWPKLEEVVATSFPRLPLKLSQKTVTATITSVHRRGSMGSMSDAAIERK